PLVVRRPVGLSRPQRAEAVGGVRPDRAFSPLPREEERVDGGVGRRDPRRAGERDRHRPRRIAGPAAAARRDALRRRVRGAAVAPARAAGMAPPPGTHQEPALPPLEEAMPTMNIIQAVNDALKLEMRRDKRVVILGEDVGKFGGVFRATSGLYEEFGADRVMDTPLAEAGIIGAAIGMALYGLRPVPEIQFADFIYPA